MIPFIIGLWPCIFILSVGLMFISMCGVNCSRRRWSGFTNIVTAMRWTWLKIADIFLERENSHRFTIYISRYTTSFSVKTHKFMNLCDFTEFLYYSTIPQLVESKDWRMRLNIQKRTMTMLEILDLLHLFFHLSHSTLNKKKKFGTGRNSDLISRIFVCETD